MKTTKLKLVRWVGGLAVAMVAGSIAMVGCSDDETTTTTDASTAKDVSTTTDTSPPATDVAIKASVTYNGSLKGPVLISVFPTSTPMGNPSGTGSNEKPTWPGTNSVDVKNVKAGKYFVFAYIMVGPDHRMGPIDGDPSGPPVEVTVVDGQTSAVNLMVFDPAPPDGGADATGDSSSDASTDAPADGG